ncbi:hypothetical protein, partial [Solicola sp. PLA-1-18]|uniref:hypothetical protein n=1 Tax=Solicola sp. PLA-1-18 TaxID=3380532 RepID=UPI003B7C0DCF
AEDWDAEVLVDALSGGPALLRVLDALDLSFSDTEPSEFPVRQQVARQMAEQAAGYARSHLLAQDVAADDGAYSALSFVRRYGNADGFRTWVVDSIENSRFSAETLASRLVSTKWLLGTDAAPELGELDQELFAQFAPEDDPLYRTDVDPDVDPRNLTWQNRRRYVRGRVRPPRPT